MVIGFASTVPPSAPPPRARGGGPGEAVQGGTGGRSHGCKFFVTPECAVEDNNIGTVNRIAQFVSYYSDARRNQSNGS